MDEEKKSKLNKVLCYVALAVLILFAIITSIILSVKHNEFDDANSKNQEIVQSLEENATLEQNNLNFVIKNIDN